MDKIALIAYYATLKEKQGKSNKGAPEYYAYHQIGTALASNNPDQALKDKIQHYHDAIAQRPNLKGYCGFYGKMIELFEKAMEELTLPAINDGGSSFNDSTYHFSVWREQQRSGLQKRFASLACWFPYALRYRLKPYLGC